MCLKGVLPGILADYVIGLFGDASHLWFVRFLSGSIWVGSTSLFFTFLNFGTIPFRFVFNLLHDGRGTVKTDLILFFF